VQEAFRQKLPTIPVPRLPKVLTTGFTYLSPPTTFRGLPLQLLDFYWLTCCTVFVVGFVARRIFVVFVLMIPMLGWIWFHSLLHL
jgi:hypothetical protein